MLFETPRLSWFHPTYKRFHPNLLRERSDHRRRIKTDEKVKVVAAVWRTELLHSVWELTILHQDDLKKGMDSSYSLYCRGATHPFLQIVLVQNG